MNTSVFSTTPSVAVRDARGLPVREIQYHRHPQAPDTTDTHITRHHYDIRGALSQSTDPRLYDLRQTDPTLKPSFVYHTSLIGTVLCTDSVDAGTSVALSDIAGRPVLAISAIGTARIWQYEEIFLLGRPLNVTEQTPDGTSCITERFVYAGHTASEQSLNLAGQCVRYYDTAGRIQLNSQSLTGAVLSQSRQLLPDEQGADWQGEDESAWGLLLSSVVHVTQTTTDATGTVVTTTDAMGNRQRTACDVAGQLKRSWLTLKDGQEQIIVASVSYSAAGQKLREGHGNGVVTTYNYEPQTQRLIGVKTERPVGHVSGAKVLQDRRYEYDPVGNVLKVINNAEAIRFWRNQKVVPGNTYTYDSLYQLVSATGREMANAGQQNSGLPSAIVPLPADSSAYTGYTRTYTYDIGGNLTQVRHVSPATVNNYTMNITVSNRSNRGVLSNLTTDAAQVEVLFTAGGQQKQLQPGQPLIWSSRNELLQVALVVREGEANDTESYRYDAGSQRVLKVTRQKTGSSTQTQRMISLPGLELHIAAAGNTETENRQVMTMGEAGSAQVRLLHWESGKPADISNNQVRYSYGDLTESAGLEVDGEGNIISQEEYYPYGGTAVLVGRNQMEVEYKTVRYSGKERDVTGLYYYGYRYYQPWAGRWLSADPAGTVDGMNLFRMVRNNPVILSDPDGLLTTGAEARERVAREFITDEHIGAFEQVARSENAILSVREAGAFTINALGKGAAAKGHNILEKTIKEKSLQPVYGSDTQNMMESAKSAGLIGLVGSWQGKGGRISGIWVHNIGRSQDEVFSLELSNKDDLMRFQDNIKARRIVPYTGDYDMHDIVLKSTGKAPEVGSIEENCIRNSINLSIASSDKTRPYDQIHMNPVRHGAQNNFVPYMWENERSHVQSAGGYLAAVAKPGPFPVAITDGDSWIVADTEDEWRGYFRNRHISQPPHWSSFPAHEELSTGLRSTTAGHVLTPEHSKVIRH